ncbi:SDR family NAD(P)-dependent oxidoreductase [Flavilitoribacter nigricans]|uniref:Oxidoreductase n=1 Tax=Flavilitoribacter nigricans (strain ATCC 23147 / DSM 23189 / NBRC 102662 / NCIMB 1420 / SS-2) TaxID=1122177 RepID=A0A2D0N4Q2_FLAN2|nr:SDR family oxidoreductase [Flavilitoribacter nigricans]PHN03475.1 oxidoreductase [Flavilitoribacter nigricans DSM 23189 = NBRC 102662]
MNLELQDKTALVTGSTAGIGLAIAKGLAAEGAEVIINGRTQARIDEAIEQIKADLPDARISGIAADFADKESVDQLLREVDRVDILVNNVGIFKPVDFADISDADWQQMLEVNVLSGVRLSRHYFGKMMEQNWGRILFISSESGVQIPAEMIHYGVSKSAQIALANGLARLTKGTQVTVNSVLPGPTNSEGVGDFLSSLAEQADKTRAEVEADFFNKERPNHLLQRFATPQEVANLVVYLSSPLASATNGAAMRVDGGTLPTIL